MCLGGSLWSSFVIAFIETLICDHAATSSGSVYICLYSDHNCLRKFPFVVNTGRTENSFVYFRLLYLLRHRHLSGLYIQSSYVQIYTNTVKALNRQLQNSEFSDFENLKVNFKSILNIYPIISNN